jgi:hypothetical protein
MTTHHHPKPNQPLRRLLERVLQQLDDAARYHTTEKEHDMATIEQLQSAIKIKHAEALDREHDLNKMRGEITDFQGKVAALETELAAALAAPAPAPDSAVEAGAIAAADADALLIDINNIGHATLPPVAGEQAAAQS